MYLPPAFREDRLEVQHDLIRAHPLGMLITAGPGGLLANTIPFLVYSDGDKGTLRAHVARANAQWKELSAVTECLVVFQGAQSYITPNWYPTKQETHKVVPTWNYITVQVRGRPRAVEDANWLLRQITDLTNAQEARQPAPWKVADAPADFVAAQIQAIVGIEIPIDRIEGKWKVSQNRNEADRKGVVAGLTAQGEASAAMARSVAERIKPV